MRLLVLCLIALIASATAEDGSFLELALRGSSSCSTPNTPNCCNGLSCPYVDGVCCGSGQHCCPAGSQCISTGSHTPPQCLTPMMPENVLPKPSCDCDKTPPPPCLGDSNIACPPPPPCFCGGIPYTVEQPERRHRLSKAEKRLKEWREPEYQEKGSGTFTSKVIIPRTVSRLSAVRNMTLSQIQGLSTRGPRIPTNRTPIAMPPAPKPAAKPAPKPAPQAKAKQQQQAKKAQQQLRKIERQLKKAKKAQQQQQKAKKAQQQTKQQQQQRQQQQQASKKGGPSPQAKDLRQGQITVAQQRFVERTVEEVLQLGNITKTAQQQYNYFARLRAETIANKVKAIAAQFVQSPHYKGTKAQLKVLARKLGAALNKQPKVQVKSAKKSLSKSAPPKALKGKVKRSKYLKRKYLKRKYLKHKNLKSKYLKRKYLKHKNLKRKYLKKRARFMEQVPQQQATQAPAPTPIPQQTQVQQQQQTPVQQQQTTQQQQTPVQQQQQQQATVKPWEKQVKPKSPRQCLRIWRLRKQHMCHLRQRAAEKRCAKGVNSRRKASGKKPLPRRRVLRLCRRFLRLHPRVDCRLRKRRYIKRCVAGVRKMSEAELLDAEQKRAQVECKNLWPPKQAICEKQWHNLVEKCKLEGSQLRSEVEETISIDSTEENSCVEQIKRQGVLPCTTRESRFITRCTNKMVTKFQEARAARRKARRQQYIRELASKESQVDQATQKQAQVQQQQAQQQAQQQLDLLKQQQAQNDLEHKKRQAERQALREQQRKERHMSREQRRLARKKIREEKRRLRRQRREQRRAARRLLRQQKAAAQASTQAATQTSSQATQNQGEALPPVEPSRRKPLSAEAKEALKRFRATCPKKASYAGMCERKHGCRNCRCKLGSKCRQRFICRVQWMKRDSKCGSKARTFRLRCLRKSSNARMSRKARRQLVKRCTRKFRTKFPRCMKRLRRFVRQCSSRDKNCPANKHFNSKCEAKIGCRNFMCRNFAVCSRQFAMKNTRCATIHDSRVDKCVSRLSSRPQFKNLPRYSLRVQCEQRFSKVQPQCAEQRQDFISKCMGWKPYSDSVSARAKRINRRKALRTLRKKIRKLRRLLRQIRRARRARRPVRASLLRKFTQVRQQVARFRAQLQM